MEIFITIFGVLFALAILTNKKTNFENESWEDEKQSF